MDKNVARFAYNRYNWSIQSWKLYSYSGVHVLETVNGLVVHMFVDKKYPLSVNLIERMLDHQLEICHDTVGNELTTAVQLIAFLKKQISDSRRPKVHDCPCLDAACLVTVLKFIKVAFEVRFKILYVVPTGKDNVIVSTSRTKVIPAGRTKVIMDKILVSMTSMLGFARYGLKSSFPIPVANENTRLMFIATSNTHLIPSDLDGHHIVIRVESSLETEQIKALVGGPHVILRMGQDILQGYPIGVHDNVLEEDQEVLELLGYYLLFKEMEINMTQLCDLDFMLDDALARVISIWMSHPKQRPNEMWRLDAVLQDQMVDPV
ncbi:hypothetical protein Tco_0523069 [Tanacetum coccineum]